VKNDARITKLERQADEAEQRKMEDLIDRVLNHDQRVVLCWYFEENLATDKDLPPSKRAEIAAGRDRSAQVIAEKTALEPAYFERITAELKSLGAL
jgi:hypothetical protein